MSCLLPAPGTYLPALLLNNRTTIKETLPKQDLETTYRYNTGNSITFGWKKKLILDKTGETKHKMFFTTA